MDDLWLDKRLEQLVKFKRREIIQRNKVTSLKELLNNAPAFYELHCAQEACYLISDLYEVNEVEFKQKVEKHGLERIFLKFANPVYNRYLAIYANSEFNDNWYDEIIEKMNNDYFAPAKDYLCD